MSLRPHWYMAFDAVETAPTLKHNQNLSYER